MSDISEENDRLALKYPNPDDPRRWCSYHDQRTENRQVSLLEAILSVLYQIEAKLKSHP